MKVLVFVEQRNGSIKSSSLEAITAARKIAKDASNVACVVVGSADTQPLSGYGAATAYTVTGSDWENYHQLNYTAAVEAAVKDFSPDAVLGIASPMGRDIFPRLAARLEAGLITDVTDIDLESVAGAVKPMYAGKVLSKVNFTGGGVKLLTLRPNSFPAEKTDGDAAAKPLDVSAAAGKITLKEIKAGASEKEDLTEAARIISGGRSLGSADNFSILDECAAVLGATVGASRAAVDSGYASHDMQVGQTGKTVNPQLYIACGISGSIQHMAGMRTSKTIVAINTDPEAPIFGVADYGIVADLFEAVPALTAKLKEVL